MAARYAGDANYTGSTSTDLAHVASAASTTTTITSDLPDPSAAGNGYTVNVTVTLSQRLSRDPARIRR